MFVFYTDSAKDRQIDRADALRRHLDQAAYVDGAIVEAIDRILAESAKPPVIVLFSDHGPGTGFDHLKPLESDLVERTSNILAAYTPDTLACSPRRRHRSRSCPASSTRTWAWTYPSPTTPSGRGASRSWTSSRWTSMRSPDPGAGAQEPFRWWRIRPYPMVFPAALVFLAWASASLHPAVLLRPLVVTVVVSLVVTVVATWLAKDRDRGALWSTVLLIMLIATDGRLFAVMAALSVVVGIAVLFWRGRAWRLGRLASTVLGGVSVVLSIALVLKFVGEAVVVESWSEFTLDNTPRATGVPSPDSPDLIVLVLDAYPGERASRIAGAGTESGAFADALQERGFQVQADSHSNYLFTGLTLGSMLTMQHIDRNPALGAPWDAADGDARRLREAVNNGKALDILAAHGYETISIASGFDHAEVRRVDRFVSPIEPGEFDVALLRLFAVGDVIDTLAPDLFSGLQRARIFDTMESAARIAAEPHDRPRFLYAHVPAPHAPWVFGRNGEPRQARLTTFYSDDPSDLKVDPQTAFDRSVEQAGYIGDRAVELVDRLLASAVRPTTIVVMSDHGTGVGLDPKDANKSDLAERFSNFLAIRTHDGQDLLATRLSPVNLFQRWFGAYLAIESAPTDDGTYAWNGSYLDAVRVHPVPEWEP